MLELSREPESKWWPRQEIEDAQVSASLDGVNVDPGLRALLIEYDVFFYDGGTGSDAVSLRTVWVFPRGDDYCSAAPLDAWAGGTTGSALVQPGSRVRQQAYKL